jgi:urea transport system permease protein
VKSSLAVLLLAACWLASILQSGAADSRSVLAEAVVTEDAIRQIELVNQLAGATNEMVARALAAWRISELFLHETTDGVKIPFLLDPQKDADDRQKGVRLVDGEFIADERGQPLAFATFELVPADTTSRLRRAIKTVLDLFAVANPNPRMRRDAVTKLGQERNPDLIPHLEARLETETDPHVIRALIEAIALTKTVNEDPAVRIAAIEELGAIRSLNGLMFLKDMEKEQHTPAEAAPQISAALRKSVLQIENHLWWGNLVGTAFRGFATAAVLLVAALGLAITFGLMGVINMAHGEIIMVGAYTAFVTQNIFKGWFGNSGLGFDSYFLVALAASFVVAASVGLILERGIIRFLYKRPLESLLATWGVSLVLQQIFRHSFGAANVQVDAPSFLSGSFAFNGSPIGFNRIFIIGFAVFIVFATWLLLTRTSLGLQIRAVMQNRAMAACVGVRTDRVNMMTFAFGSGLAGMAGACLSQIGNVGPSLGQNYIVDCFMIVVLGGVGNLVGTVSASLGVGVTNQLLEPWLGAVLGKIVVLTGIILFLQWRPSGLFATRSRSLDG